MIHPDNQHYARIVLVVVALTQMGICDVMFGNCIRTRRKTMVGAILLQNYLVNRTSTVAENLELGQSIGDFHSGFRAYSRCFLKAIPFRAYSEDLAFDEEFLMQAINAGFSIGDVPVPVRSVKEDSGISVHGSTLCGFEAIGAFARMKMHHWRWRYGSPFESAAAPECSGAKEVRCECVYVDPKSEP